MASASTPATPLSREVVQLHATRLRARILKGECPYPDAVLGANESFLRTLHDSPGASVATLQAEHGKLQDRAEGWKMAFAAAGLIGGAVVGIFAATCPPGPASAVAAAFGAVASRLCLRLSGRAADRFHRHQTFTEQLHAWTAHDSDAPPKVPAWQGPVTAKGLKFLAKDFPAELDGFPYAHQVRQEHARLLQHVEKAGDRPLEDVKTELLARSRRSDTAARAASVAGRFVANAAWVGAAAALAAGQPWVAAGLGGAVVAGFGLRVLADRAAEAGPEARTTARSLHYWQEAMAAVPPTTPHEVIFGTPSGTPKEPGRIEASPEDVLIGGVRVPVKAK